MPKLKSVDVSLKFPEVFELTGTWEADEAQQLAAWEIYVELVTRVAVVALAPGRGLLRETLTSLHELFDVTRTVLRKGGPELARPPKKTSLSLAIIAVDVLNRGVRPFLSTWHPLLETWEAGRPRDRSAAEHEMSWENNRAMRAQLEGVQKILRSYADLLGTVAGVPPLL